MRDIELDNEEQEILDAFEAGELLSELTPERRQFIERSARQTFKKDTNISIRISDLVHDISTDKKTQLGQ